MKKIIIEKQEDIAGVIDRVFEVPDVGIVLVLPRGADVGRSPRNFHLLRREMEAAGRQLEIESVDEQILAFAKDAGIPNRHPLLTRATGNLSDIVPVMEKTPSKPAKEEVKKRTTKGKVSAKSDKSIPIKIEVPEEEDIESADSAQEEPVSQEIHPPVPSFFERGRFFKDEDVAEEEEDDDDNDRGTHDSRPRKPLPWRGIRIAVGVIVVIVAIAFGVTKFFGHATVGITFVKTPWQYAGPFAADKSVASADSAQKVLPAQVFFETKNITQLYPASGSANVKTAARGSMVIYNAYSSASQELVATTRFATPDGKIFRLADRVVVPGAEVSGGKITPSSITATVVADQAGPDYNLGPIAKLTIPGFEKSPKYDGFYGVIASGTTGGFSGTRPVPTTQDITNAKASTTLVLQNAIASATGLDIPSNFKILDGATNVQIARLTVNTSTDQSGKFSVFGQVTFQAIGFEEDALKSVLSGLAQATQASSSFSSFDVSYSAVKPDFTKGRVTFSIAARGSLMPALTLDDLKSQLAGMSIANARAAIASLPNLQDGTISVWPVWLWNMPGDPGKITVNVN